MTPKIVLTGLLTLGVLAACDEVPTTSGTAPVVVHRAYADSFQDHPFDEGAITVLAEEHGELRSFVLRPCGGNAICGASTGRLLRTRDYWVVKGAYPGRDFYVSAGGDGWVKRSGAYHPIAWN